MSASVILKILSYFHSDGDRPHDGKGLCHHGGLLDGAFPETEEQPTKKLTKAMDWFATLTERSLMDFECAEPTKSTESSRPEIVKGLTPKNSRSEHGREFTQPCLSDRRTTSLLLRSK